MYKGDKYLVLDIIECENMEDTALLGLTNVSDDLDELVDTAEWEVQVRDLKLIWNLSCTHTWQYQRPKAKKKQRTAVACH